MVAKFPPNPVNPASLDATGKTYDLDPVVDALTAVGVDATVEPRAGIPAVVVAGRLGTNNWVEIISQGEARYLTCGYIGPVADPDDVTILAVGPLSETASVTAAWIGL